ncbi:MAG TPA: MoxR family ATPase [Candidatus Nanoarchaeia archaeon]|nr:MoxR family ATPase [Candidatus Nanoarchaeia archaeon]
MTTVENVKRSVDYLITELNKVVIGQDPMIRQLLVAILCDANALLESYPGLAKTLAVKSLAEIMDLKFARIQNTPDLMPSDITGTYIIEEEDGKRNFKFQPGPIFANIVLADEINRATPKTQAALLEAMQEKQVTVGNKTFALDRPFFVLATQNPIEQEGTYPLPEAQSDRFLLKILVDYPKIDDEIKIVNLYAEDAQPEALRRILKKESILQLQKLTRQVPISNDLKKYVVDLVNTTRNKKDLIEFGASPRASIGLVLASKARALIDGRKFVSKNDINEMALPILRHRIILNFEAERQGLTVDDVIKKLLK